MEANDVIRNARLLRDADDIAVRNYVFINKDMTKEEAKAAFDRREARRAKPKCHNVVHLNGTNLSATAASFNPSSFPIPILSAIPTFVDPPGADSFSPIDLSITAPSLITPGISDPSNSLPHVSTSSDINGMASAASVSTVNAPGFNYIGTSVAASMARPLNGTDGGRPGQRSIAV